MAALIKHFSPAAKPYHLNPRYGSDKGKSYVAAMSRTVYVGNLAYVTTDAQVHALFSRCGPVERVVMGLNRLTRRPCGFCFVIFIKRESVITAVQTLNGTMLDERLVKVELDQGFKEGRQYGRGESGGQVRDDLREGYDEGRGGYGTAAAAAMASPSTPSSNDGGGRRYSGVYHRGTPGMGNGDAGGGGRPGYTPRSSYGGGGGRRDGYAGGGGRGGRRDGYGGRDSMGGGHGGDEEYSSGMKRRRAEWEGGGGGGGREEDGGSRRADRYRERDELDRDEAGMRGGEHEAYAALDEFGRVRRLTPGDDGRDGGKRSRVEGGGSRSRYQEDESALEE